MNTNPKPEPTEREELREKILALGICTGPYDMPHRCSSMHCNHCGLCDTSEDLVNVILADRKAQKQQLLERIRTDVVGEDFPRPPLGDFWNVGRNQLRNEQRAVLKEMSDE